MAKAHKLPSGTWRCIASWTDEYGNHKQKSFTAKTKEEAELAALRFKTETVHLQQPNNKTLDQLIASFIENRSNLLSPSTIVGYNKIRKNAFHSIANTRLGLLTPELYQKAINEYAKDHSAKSVANAHALAKEVLRANDCFIAEKAILPQKENSEVSIPTEEEVKKLLDYVKDTRLYLLVAFSVYLGLRKSETVALKWKDIDFDKKSVSISKARVQNVDRVYVEKTTKTTSSKRTLKIPNVLMSSLPSKDEVKPNEYIIDDSIDALVSFNDA